MSDRYRVYEDVHVFGRVVMSNHAMMRADAERISDEHIAAALERGKDTPDVDSTLREHNGVRLVVIRPTPWRGAMLVKTVYRVQAQAVVK